MKILLIAMAVVEAAAGAAFLLIPAIAFSSLLSVPLDTPGGLVAARIAGAAIIGLAVACWRARNSAKGGAASGIVAAMLFYNIAAALIIVWAGLRLGIQSPVMWPAMVAHAALGSWCFTVLWLEKRRAA
ncbi:MAG: hypothetical protein H7070_00105 [Saprospiraceae bacterium]|nr:hypothetical protein [Pyrinomonadaceae bacterium]